MRDDLAALNIGTAEPNYKKEFFWRSYRDIEMFMTRVLSKGPCRVSTLTADDIAADMISFGGSELNVYDVSTWTPTINFGGNAVGITYSSTQYGFYTKIGNRCLYNLYFALTAKGSSTGQVRILLPFTAAGGAVYSPCCCTYYQGMALPVAAFPGGYVQAGANYILGTTPSTVTGHTTLTDAHFTNNSSLIISGHYPTA
jgi:hypothetical protein